MTYDNKSYRVVAPATQSLYKRDSLSSFFLLRLSRYRVKEENSFFAFSLGCRPDQDNYFTERQDSIRNPAQVMVYGTSDASLPSFLSLPVALVAVILVL